MLRVLGKLQKAATAKGVSRPDNILSLSKYFDLNCIMFWSVRKNIAVAACKCPFTLEPVKHNQPQPFRDDDDEPTFCLCHKCCCCCCRHHRHHLVIILSRTNNIRANHTIAYHLTFSFFISRARNLCKRM